MKKLFLIFITLICAVTAAASGVPQVRNFTRTDYDAAPQNWSVAQDSLGRIYVGNGYCMLIFDGRRWSKIGLPNSTTVRALMYDGQTARMYAAGTEEVGYFSADSVNAGLKYTSLMPLFGNGKPPFTEIWKFFKIGNHIWFQSDFHLTDYDGTTAVTHRADGRISVSALIDGRIYVGFDDGRVQTFNGTSFHNLAGGKPIADSKIVGILPRPDSDNIIAVTADDGLFDVDNRGARRIDNQVSRFLRENRAFCAATNGNIVVLGTVNRGAVVINKTTGTTKYINKENGLQNNTVLNATFDCDDNVWLGLDNGLSLMLTNSPVNNLVGPADDIGAGYCSLLYGGQMLFGTNQGLYSTPYPFAETPSRLQLRRELNGQIWSINNDGGTLFIGSDSGLYVDEGGTWHHVDGTAGTFLAAPLDGDPNRAIAATYHGFRLLKRENGRWVDDGSIYGYDDISGNFVQHGRYIWLPHWRKGIYRLHLDPTNRRFTECILFNAKSGLPADNNNDIMLLDGRIIASTVAGFYAFDYASNTFVKDDLLSDTYSGIANGKLLTDSVSIRPLQDKIIPGFLNINRLSPEEMIVSNQEGFWSINPTVGEKAPSRPPFVSAVYVNGDSLVYLAGNQESKRLTLPYSHNSLKFNFACCDYQSLKSLEFSSRLEDYDAEFSPFSSEASREYTRLNEGEYTLRVRMRNAMGDILETDFPLTVTPPWYRTVGAKLACVIIVAMMLVGAYFLTMNRIRASRRRLEQRKDYEIAALKSEQLEQDIRNKSNELSNTTMNLIRKNEILQEIAGQIEHLTPTEGSYVDAATLRRQLAKIHKRIEENIGHDDDQKEFVRNFDIVYQDYTKRLIERHPTLTAADKRMCCYIKMGLSSKEIAPLVNISFKSVEMARYRLRKKMEIPAETSLADYLASI